MRNVFNKSSRKNIFETLGRYLSLVSVTFLGAGVFAGLLAIAPEMRETADNYFDKYDLMDARLQSPLGFTRSDVDKIRDLDRVSVVQEGNFVDSIGEVNKKKYTMRIHSYSNKDNKLNTLEVVKGRLPKKRDETVISIPPGGLKNINIDETVQLDSKEVESVIHNSKLKIVGVVKSAMYPHNMQANTSKGSGNVEFVLFTSQKNFISKIKSEIFVKFRSTHELNSFSDEYERKVNQEVRALKKISRPQSKKRFDDVSEEVQEAKKKLSIEKNASEIEFNKIQNQLNQTNEELKIQNDLLDSQDATLQKNKSLMPIEEYSQKLLELNTIKNQLENAKDEYDKKSLEFEKEKSRVSNELKTAEDTLNEDEKDLKGIKSPQWFFETRNQNQGYAIYKGDAESMAGMASIFPIIFFLVSALVSLTTMTRMIDDERILIGTFKSLGYSNKKIAWRYLIYSMSATLCGSVLGVILGFKVLPKIIWEAYSHQYNVPDPSLRFHWSFAFLSIVTMLFITTVVTYLTIRKNLKETTSELLLQKAPPSGKRILLEKLPFIWTRLSFSQKVTQRNIFLDKKRMTMAIIGVVGSTALLVTGFSLRNSANNFPKQQYQQIMKYDFLGTLKEGKTDSSEFRNFLDDKNNVSDYLLFREESIEIQSDSSNKERQFINLVTPDNSKKINRFIELKNNNKKINFAQDSVVLTNNIAKILKVAIGDKIKVKLLDSADFIEMRVTGISENLELNYLYISRKLYLEKFDQSPKLNTAFFKIPAKATPNVVKKKTDNIDTFSNIDSANDKMEKVKDELKSIDMVVIILIILASLLAIVVLYNVTNINIEERKREIATIKVLGFYNHETNSYVLRETIGLSIMGTILGLFLGVFLFMQVIQSIETEFYVFDKTLSFPPFFYAAVCVLLYTVFVNVMMMPKIRSIDMLESLKSNE